MSAIKLYSITQRTGGGGSVTTSKRVVADNSVTASTTSKRGQIWVGKLKKITKKTYEIKKGKKGYIPNGGIISKDWQGWFLTGGVNQVEQNNMYYTKRFTKKTGSGSSAKYYYWDVVYFAYYKTRYLTSTYTFTVQPKSMTVTLQDLDVEDENAGTDVGRNKKGYIVRNRVRKNVRTIECEFPPLEQSEINAMMPFIMNQSGQGYIKLRYDDPYTGDTTIDCYAGDRTFEAGPFGKWLNFKVTFVEV